MCRSTAIRRKQTLNHVIYLSHECKKGVSGVGSPCDDVSCSLGGGCCPDHWTDHGTAAAVAEADGAPRRVPFWCHQRRSWHQYVHHSPYRPRIRWRRRQPWRQSPQTANSSRCRGPGHPRSHHRHRHLRPPIRDPSFGPEWRPFLPGNLGPVEPRRHRRIQNVRREPARNNTQVGPG